MKSPRVSIIIVNWNGGQVFKNCLSSLKKINYKNWELIVVDNGSTDESHQLPKKLKIKNSKLLKNKKNAGFAKANNQGYKLAKGELILLLNNDTKVTADFLSVLVSKLKSSEELGIVQPKILLIDKPTHLDSVGSYLTRTGFLQHWGLLEKDSKKYSKETFIFSAKGACMLIKREVIETVGLFDSDYVSYLEETDFCWRVWLAGYKILYYPKAKIYHKVGFTSKRKDQLDVNYHSFKNRIATLFKNLSLFHLFTIGSLHIIIITGLSLYYLFSLRLKSTLIIWRAILWNIGNIHTQIKKRSNVQNTRTVSDSKIFIHILKPTDYGAMTSHFLRAEKMLQGEHEV